MSSKTNRPDTVWGLTRHAINALLNDRHAGVGGRSRATRAKNLHKISAIYSLEKLLEERGVGTATAAEIQLWLEERVASLRLSD